jgi:hypothetical protein
MHQGKMVVLWEIAQVPLKVKASLLNQVAILRLFLLFVVLFCFVLTKQEITLTCHWLILFFDSTGV